MNISEINSYTEPSFMILVADDDPDDRFLLGLAFEELQGVGELHFVEDGEQLMNYLYRQGKYTDPVLCPQAKLIFLDLNMPRKNGRQALAEIKADRYLMKIPVIVWSSSSSEEDIAFCHKAGADFYCTKPGRYGEMVEVVRGLVAKYSFKESKPISIVQKCLHGDIHGKAVGPLLPFQVSRAALFSDLSARETCPLHRSPRLCSGPGLPPQISHEKRAPSRQSLQKRPHDLPSIGDLLGGCFHEPM